METNAITPPEGFELDTPTASTQPPEGFQIDSTTSAAAPPEGFVVDAPSTLTSRFKEDQSANWKSSFGDIAKTYQQPFTPDKSPGPEWLQKIGNYVGRPAADAGMAVASPFISAAESAAEPVAGSFGSFVADKMGATPDQAQEIGQRLRPSTSKVIGSSVAGAALGAIGGAEIPEGEALAAPEVAAKTPLTDILQTATDRVHNDTLANLSMSAKQPWKKTGTEIDSVPAQRSVEDIDNDINMYAANTDRVGYKTALAKLQQEKADVLNPQNVVDQVARTPNGEITDEQFQNNIKQPVQNALDKGVPVDRVQRELEASLPKTFDDGYRQSLIDKAIPANAKNIADAAPEVSKVTGVPSDTVQGLLLPKDSGISDTTSPNVVKEAIDSIRPITAKEAKLATGESQNVGIKSFLSDESSGKGPPQAATVAQYDGLMNNFGLLDNLNRVWARVNKINIGRNDIVELSDTALTKNISDRGNYGGLSYLGPSDGTGASVFRNKPGTSELVEDTNILPYQTVKANAVKAGIAPEDLNQINLARNALDDYSNIEKVAAGHATNILENDKKIAQLRAVQEQPENTGFFKRYDIEAQIRTLMNENKGSAKAAKMLNEKESYMPKADAAAIMQKFAENPAASEYITGLNKIHGALLDDLVTAGKIAPEIADRLKNAHPNYIPAYRTADDFTFDSASKQGWYGTLPKAFYKRKIGETGGGQIDAEGNIVRNILSTVQKRESSAIRGSIFNNLYKILDDDAWSLLFRESKADVGKAIDKLQSSTLDRLPADEITPFHEDRVQHYNTINFDLNGKQIELSVKDENLYKSIANSYGQYEPGNAALKAGIFLSRLKRAGIIDLDPTFPIRNAMRGVMDFPVNSRRMIPLKDYIPIVSQVKTAVGTLFDKDFYNQYSINYGFGNKLSKSYGMKSTDAIVDMIKGNKQPSPVMAPFHFMQDVNSRVDAGTRILQYRTLFNKLVDEGMDANKAHEAAMIASKEAHLRFNQRGNNNSLNIVLQMIPLSRTFVNAMDKSLKMGVYAPTTFAVGGAQIFMVYKAIQAYNRQYLDNDGVPFVDKLDPRIMKDGMPIYYGQGQNKFFKYPLGWIYGRSMPAWDKSFDYTMQYLGKAYPAMMEDKANQIVKQTPEFSGKVTGRQVADAWMDWTFKWMTPESALPPPLAMAVGLHQNQDDNGNPIVPPTLNDKAVPSHLQYYNSTDASLVEFTNILNKKYGVDLSPAKAQFVARELAGTFGETSMKAGAHLYSALSGNNPPAPERGDIPGFKLFSENTSDVPHTGVSAKYYSVYKEALEPIEATAATLKKKAQDYPEASMEYNKYLQDHATELYWAAKYKAANQAISKVNGAIEQTINAKPGSLKGVQELNPGLFGDAKKREEVTRLKEEVISIQNGVLQGLVNDLDKGNTPTNDIYSHSEDHAPLTKAINNLLPSENPPKKTLDNPLKKSDNSDANSSPIMSFLQGLNPVSDAEANTIKVPQGKLNAPVQKFIQEKDGPALEKAAKTHGVNVNEIMPMINAESTINAHTGNGYAQITPPAWKDAEKAAGRTLNRHNQTDYAEATVLTVKKTIDGVQQVLGGGKPSVKDWYIAYNAGLTGYKKLKDASPNASAADVVGSKTADNNKFYYYNKQGDPYSVKQTLQLYRSNMQKKMDEYSQPILALK